MNDLQVIIEKLIAQGMSEQDIADKIGHRMTQQSISNYRKGREPSPPLLKWAILQKLSEGKEKISNIQEEFCLEWMEDLYKIWKKNPKDAEFVVRHGFPKYQDDILKWFREKRGHSRDEKRTHATKNVNKVAS